MFWVRCQHLGIRHRQVGNGRVCLYMRFGEGLNCSIVQVSLG